VKIPISLCILISGGAFGISYWLGIRNYDFVTPPAGYNNIDPELFLEIPEKNQGLDKVPSDPDKVPVTTTSVPPVTKPAEVAVTIEDAVGSQISDYVDQKNLGSEGYIELAEKLAADKKPEHSLVAWERVLDSSKPSVEQIKRAFDILKVQKPVLPCDKENSVALSITVHCSVPVDMKERATQMINRLISIIHLGSGHSLNVDPDISTIPISVGKPRPPVTVWFSGKVESPRASFRTSSAKDLGLDSKLDEVIFNIVGPYLEENSDLTPFTDIPSEINAEECLAYLITRHSWRTFGILLYTEAEDSNYSSPR
jgi:hypothetical protein